LGEAIGKYLDSIFGGPGKSSVLVVYIFGGWGWNTAKPRFSPSTIFFNRPLHIRFRALSRINSEVGYLPIPDIR
jgi:hypothetical protein